MTADMGESLQVGEEYGGLGRGRTMQGAPGSRSVGWYQEDMGLEGSLQAVSLRSLV